MACCGARECIVASIQLQANLASLGDFMSLMFERVHGEDDLCPDQANKNQPPGSQSVRY